MMVTIIEMDSLGGGEELLYLLSYIDLNNNNGTYRLIDSRPFASS